MYIHIIYNIDVLVKVFLMLIRRVSHFCDTATVSTRKIHLLYVCIVNINMKLVLWKQNL